MEEKESTISGSPENTESGSPTPISFASGGGGGGGGAISAPPSDPQSVSAAVSGVGKKRGRPRKYDAEGNLSPAYTAAVARKAATAVTQAAAAAAASVGVTQQPQSAGFSLTTMAPNLGGTTPKSTSSSYDFGSGKKGRGRGATTVGTANWQPFGLSSSLSELFADTAGADFTPHVLTVQQGEDVAAKIHGVGQKAPRGICVLSANGTVSNVTIRQPGSSNGLLTYEGRFELLSLSGSYIISEAGGITSKNGGLSITLAGPDGRVVGGSVAGWIVAANPVQVVVGSFVPNSGKPQKRKYHREPPTASMMPAFPDTTPAEIPNTQPMLHYHEGGPPVVSPVPAHSQSEADDSIGSGHNLNVVSSHDTPEWNNGSEPHRLYPDINVSVPGV